MVAAGLHLTALQNHALEYAAAGFEIFPVNARTKAPHASQYKATTSPQQIAAWWQQWPDALIGHRIAPQHVLLDIDPRHNGGDVWAKLRADHDFDSSNTRRHISGRGDGGGHAWFNNTLNRGEHYTTAALDQWAREQKLGEPHGDRWTAGIDILHHTHRYTILPPSPHPETGQPYKWSPAADHPIIPLPGWLHHLIVAVKPAPTPAPPTPSASHTETPIEWVNRTHDFVGVLAGHGWTLIQGDGNRDGSLWRHPTATAAHSASISRGCLYIHTPNTPFQPTTPSDPHGYDVFDCWRILGGHGDRSAAAKTALELRDGPRPHDDPSDLLPDAQPQDAVEDERRSIFIRWPDFWRADDSEERWLYDDVLAIGRGHAFYASHKVGKSLLMLHLAAHIATSRPDVTVIYLDYEMTEEDVRERLLDMGHDEDSDLTRLRYALLPTLPPLDTAQGGQQLQAIVETERDEHPGHHLAVIIDTFSRAVEGEENSNDTTRNFYLHTGIRLKRLGVTWARLDHAGKDPTKGQRGGSAKGDDVDVVWQVTRGDGGDLALKRDVARMGWVPQNVAFKRGDDPLTFTRTEQVLPDGTWHLVAVLDDLHAPALASKEKARAWLKSVNAEQLAAALEKHHDPQTNNDVLHAAVRARKARTASRTVSDLVQDGTKP